MRLLLNQKFKWQRRTRWRHTVSCSSSPRSIDDWPESQKNYQFCNWLRPSHTHRHTHTETHLPDSLASLDSLSRILSSIYSCTASPHGQAKSRPGPGQVRARAGASSCFVIYAHLLCGFLPHFVLWLTSWTWPPPLLSSGNQQICIWLAKWTIGRVDKRTRAKVNLRPAAGFQKCISNTRVLVSYTKSRLLVCVCSPSASRSRRTVSVKPIAKLYSPIQLAGFILPVCVERNTLDFWFNYSFYVILLALQRVQFVLRPNKVDCSLSATQFICYKANLSVSFDVIFLLQWSKTNETRFFWILLRFNWFNLISF